MDARQRAQFIREFADQWRMRGIPHKQGQIMAYLLLDESGEVSAAQLADELEISRGAISMHVRALIDAGMVHLERKPGERSHYYRVDEDVWGGFLVAEQEHLRRQQRLAANALAHVRPDSPTYRRLANMERYMRWAGDLELAEQWLRHHQSHH